VSTHRPGEKQTARRSGWLLDGQSLRLCRKGRVQAEFLERGLAGGRDSEGAALASIRAEVFNVAAP